MICDIVRASAARQASRELEERFPGRWNPKRSLHAELRPLVQAAADALQAAGWGPDPETAIVIGIDSYGDAPGAAFQAQLASGGTKPLRPSDFLSSLPSTPAATLGMVLGLGGYQATLSGGGDAGLQALLHARVLVKRGRAPRVLVGALSSEGEHVLGVAACVASPEPRVGRGAGTSDLLLDLPTGYLSRAAPRLLQALGLRSGRSGMATPEQTMKVKQMLVEQLHLRMDPKDIGDDAPLFGQAGLGLDSVDGIELVNGIKERFSYEFPSEDEARKVLRSCNTLADHLVSQGKL